MDVERRKEKRLLKIIANLIAYYQRKGNGIYFAID